MTQTKKAQIMTTGRAAPLRMTLGCLLLGIGMGWILALITDTAYAYVSLQLLRDTAHGMGGILCTLMPLFAVWGGVLLCMSAKRRVSARAYLILLLMYWIALAIVTLTSHVGDQPLLIYIANGNKIWLGMRDNTTFGAYLTGAYQVRAMNNGSVAGGGLLGMLLAFPLYCTRFSAAGSAFILGAAEAFLVMILLRINPFEMWKKINEQRDSRKQSAQEGEQEEEEQAPPLQPAYRQQIPVQPLIPTQQVTYSTGTSVQSDVEESYLVEEHAQYDEYASVDTPADHGFVPVETGVLHEEHIPVGDDYAPVQEKPKRVRRSVRRAEEKTQVQQDTEPSNWQQSAEPSNWQQSAEPSDWQQSAEPSNWQQSAEPSDWQQSAEPSDWQQSAEPSDWQQDTAPVQTSGRRRRSAAARAENTQKTAMFANGGGTQPNEDAAVQFGRQADWNAETVQQTFDVPVVRTNTVKKTAESAPAPAPVRMRSGSHATGEVQQVFTDPAVDMGGKRIPISPRSESAPKEDPFAVKHTRQAVQEVKSRYTAPPMNMLRDMPKEQLDSAEEDRERAMQLEHTLQAFSIDAKVSYVVHGPAITRFALKLADGVNVKRLNGVSSNLAMAVQAVDLRIEAPIRGTSLVGIEVPNLKVRMVTLKEVLESPAMRQNKSPTAVALGVDVAGTPIVCDLAEMPHTLIAGATGSGKSVCINSIIMSILYRATPQQVRMLMIDPKVVELQPYNGIPHLLTDVISDPKKAAAALDWVVQEMNERYRRFQKLGVRKIDAYNSKVKDKADRMSNIVVIIDEFSDLMVQCRKQVEESIQRLAALARAAGIYMIVATQRPSVDVITGVIKANIPSRIAFAVANNVDSRTIIDTVGAEKLLGRGDMLYFPRSEFKAIRVQGCFVSDDEVASVADYVKDNNDAVYDGSVEEHVERIAREEEQASESAKHPNDPEYQTNTENEMLQRAIEMAVECGQMSISMLRRRLGLGHSRAGKLIDTMASMGIVSQDEGPKARRTLITREEYIKMQGQILDE